MNLYVMEIKITSTITTTTATTTTTTTATTTTTTTNNNTGKVNKKHINIFTKRTEYELQGRQIDI